MLSSLRIIIRSIPEIHTMEKCNYLESIIHLQIILVSIPNNYRYCHKNIPGKFNMELMGQ